MERADAAPALGAWREQALERWRAFSDRERQALAAAGVLLALVLAWLVAVQPALRTLKTAPIEADALEAQWQQMQRLAAESRELRGAVPVSAAQSAEALRAATVRLGAQGRLVLAGDRATLTLTNASGAQLAAWLAEARSAARACVVEATLTRTPQGYDGSVVVALGSAS